MLIRLKRHHILYNMELPSEIWSIICQQSRMTIADVVAETDIDTLRGISKQITNRIYIHDEKLLNQISVGDIVSILNNPEYADCLFIVQNIFSNGVFDNNIYIQQIVPDLNGRIFGKYRREYGCGCKTHKSVHLLKIEVSVSEQRNTLNEYISKLVIGDNIRFINRDGALLSGTVGKIYSKFILTSNGERVSKTNLVMKWV